MLQLLDEYDHYDLTTDILAAWSYYQHDKLPEAYFDCVGSLGSVDSDGRFHSECDPDYTLTFQAEGYGLIGEIKASLSTGEDNLRKVAEQIERRSKSLFAFRSDPDSKHHFTPPTQDVLLIVPAAKAAPAAKYLRQNLTKPENGQHVSLSQFVDETNNGRTLVFSRYPVERNSDCLRDGFLSKNRRISEHLGNGIRISYENYQLYRDRIIAGSDGMLSSLGVLIKILEAVQELYGYQLKRVSYGDEFTPNPISFSLPDLLTKLRTPPFFCAAKTSQVKKTLLSLSRSAPFLKIEKSTWMVTYSIRKSYRFSLFRRDELIGQLPRRHSHGNLPLLAFHLARGILLEKRLTAETQKPSFHQYSLGL
jgi:hypothetical protein